MPISLQVATPAPISHQSTSSLTRHPFLFSRTISTLTSSLQMMAQPPSVTTSPRPLGVRRRAEGQAQSPPETSGLTICFPPHVVGLSMFDMGTSLDTTWGGFGGNLLTPDMLARAVRHHHLFRAKTILFSYPLVHHTIAMSLAHSSHHRPCSLRPRSSPRGFGTLHLRRRRPCRPCPRHPRSQPRA